MARCSPIKKRNHNTRIFDGQESETPKISGCDEERCVENTPTSCVFLQTHGTAAYQQTKVCWTCKFRAMSFAYDANGRMVKASKTNTPDAWTVFDAFGNRVATKTNDVWQFVIYDAFGKPVAEWSARWSAGSLPASNARAFGKRLPPKNSTSFEILIGAVCDCCAIVAGWQPALQREREFKWIHLRAI